MNYDDSYLAELRAAGISPDCPMSSRRLKGDPVRLRFGDDLIMRSCGGQITHTFGYFTPCQIAARQAWAKALDEVVSRRGTRLELP